MSFYGNQKFCVAYTAGTAWRRALTYSKLVKKFVQEIFLWPSQVEATPESLRESSLTWLTVHVPLSQVKVLESS